MWKKLTLICIFCLLMSPLTPTMGRCWYQHHYHGGGYGAAVALGVTGLVLGTAIAASAYNPPPPTVVYAAPPPAYVVPVYAAAAVPPGSCRWERMVLDRHGRPVLDRYGYPIKEYTIGSCQYPPY